MLGWTWKDVPRRALNALTGESHGTLTRAIYRRAGVEEYFILDQMTTPWTLETRRLHPATGRYRKLRPGKNARVSSATLEVLFEVGEDGKSLVLTDLRTGEGLRDHRGEAEARRAAEERYRTDVGSKVHSCSPAAATGHTALDYCTGVAGAPPTAPGWH